jgi:hypothetical protein
LSGRKKLCGACGEHTLECVIGDYYQCPCGGDENSKPGTSGERDGVGRWTFLTDDETPTPVMSYKGRVKGAHKQRTIAELNKVISDAQDLIAVPRPYGPSVPNVGKRKVKAAHKQIRKAGCTPVDLDKPLYGPSPLGGPPTEKDHERARDIFRELDEQWKAMGGDADHNPDDIGEERGDNDCGWSDSDDD